MTLWLGASWPIGVQNGAWRLADRQPSAAAGALARVSHAMTRPRHAMTNRCHKVARIDPARSNACR
jgi:hypothetical protein